MRVSDEAHGEVGEDVLAVLSQLRDQARSLERNVEKVAESLGASLPKRKRGRPRKHPLPIEALGTAPPATLAGDKPEPEPEAPVEPPRPPDVRERIQAALTRESLSVQQLAKAVNEPTDKVETSLRDLRAEQKVFNVGLGERPLWTWRIGDKTDAPTLNALIRRLIAERPMTARELSDATGARMSRVNGQLVEIQRSGANIVNMGEGHRYRWFLISDQVKDARLPPKYARQPKPKTKK